MISLSKYIHKNINESVNEGVKTQETESNKFESEISDNIKNFLSKQQSPYNTLNVEHYSESDLKYHSDIKISNPKTDKDIWVEVKKDKYANLGSSSWKYSKGNWTCSTLDDEDPLTPLLLNSITEHSKKFISFCKTFLKTEDINIPKDLTPELISAWKKSGSIEDTDNDVQFITEKIPLDGFGEKIAEYYKTAKNEPVYYMQVGDELYIIDSNYNPLNIRPRTGGELKSVSEAYRIGRIQFRAKGIEKKLKDDVKYYYSVVCDVKILADKENQDKEYKCSFKTQENYPIIKDTEIAGNNVIKESLSKTTIREIPQQDIEDILDVIKNSNPRYDRSQFTKNLQDGSRNNKWIGCFDEKNELMALALVQEDSPYSGMYYINEIQSFQKGYGAILLSEILKKFNKVWLMCDSRGGEDLKEFYRRKEFHLEEYVIPNSVYDVPVSFFYTKNIDSDKLITYLDTFFSNGDEEEIDESKKFRYSLKDKEDTYKPEKNNYKFKNKSEKYGGDDYIKSFEIIERACPNIISKYGAQNWFKGKDSLDSSKSNTYFELDDGKDTRLNVGKIKLVGGRIVALFKGSSPMRTTDFMDKLIDETMLGSSIIIYMNEEDESVYCCNAIRNEGDDIILEMEWSDVTDYKQLVSEEEIRGEKSNKQPTKGVKIWIDDIRPVPEGYVGIKSVNEFIDYIKKHGYGGISLIDTDHDAGDYQEDGGDYINCFDYLRSIGAKNLTIHIHSANPVGANHIRQIISRCKEDGWKEI